MHYHRKKHLNNIFSPKFQILLVKSVKGDGSAVVSGCLQEDTVTDSDQNIGGLITTVNLLIV